MTSKQAIKKLCKNLRTASFHPDAVWASNGHYAIKLVGQDMREFIAEMRVIDYPALVGKSFLYNDGANPSPCEPMIERLIPENLSGYGTLDKTGLAEVYENTIAHIYCEEVSGFYSAFNSDYLEACKALGRFDIVWQKEAHSAALLVSGDKKTIVGIIMPIKMKEHKYLKTLVEDKEEKEWREHCDALAKEYDGAKERRIENNHKRFNEERGVL